MAGSHDHLFGSQMNLVLSLLIIAANPTAANPTGAMTETPSAASEIATPVTLETPAHRGQSDAVEVFQCGFEESWDKNFDQWPDRWRRQTGEKFPHYVDVGITGGDAAQGKSKLSIQLNR